MKYYSVNIDNFIDEIIKINAKIDKKIISKAFNFTKKAHHNQKRASGESYIVHPANVAYLLAEMQMDTSTVVAGILHDVIEDTSYSNTDIENKFGQEIAQIVEGVTKIESYNYKQKEKHRKKIQAENFRKLLMSVTKDIRVIIVKLADRLHNMRTLKYLNHDKQKRIARETMDIYAAIANRFGLGKIKWELEDLSFKYLHPKKYTTIRNIVASKKDKREYYILRVINIIEQSLKRNGIYSKISGRSKHFYSIFRKNKERKVPYEEIYDLAALRIIVENVEDCYHVLGLIHDKFEPIGRFRDYIARPKPNGYQSLHTIVIGLDNKKVEIQIRTSEMHLYAEEGVAAHWRYKEFNYSPSSNPASTLSKKGFVEPEFEKHLSWIRKFLKKQQKGDNHDFMEDLKLDLYPDTIFVQSPKGDFYKLPKNSTPLDFAFAVHTDLGLSCKGAKINSKMASLKTRLQTGDVVEVFSDNQPNPSRDWLSFLNTSRARQKVRSFIKKWEQEDATKLGEEIFAKKAKKHSMNVNSQDDILQIARSFRINGVKDFYAEIGKGKILFKEILAKVRPDRTEEKTPRIKQQETKTHQIREVVQGIKLEGVENLMIRYAKCCNPIPGDRIIGYITRGRGVTIHRTNCKQKNFKKLLQEQPDRFIDIDWEYRYTKDHNNMKLITIRILGKNLPNLLMDILNTFNKRKVDLKETEMKVVKGRKIGNFSFYIDTTSNLKKLLKALRKLRGISNIENMTS